MLTKCPFCFGKVLLKADQTCPACNQFVDENGPEPVHEIVSVAEKQNLPKICVGCGEPATTFSMLKIERHDDGKAVLAVVLSKLLPALFRGTSGISTIRIDLPKCADCEAIPNDSPHRGLDMATGTVRIVVHRNFARVLAGN